MSSIILIIIRINKNEKIEGITNLTPSYNKLIISFDLTVTNFKKIKDIIENLEVKETY
jgi:allophanate hydrolase subunit 1